MFHSPLLSHSTKQQSPIRVMSTKTVIDEKSKTIEQLKALIDDLKLRHERKEQELLKRIGILYNEVQQNKKKMAHLIYKHQQQRKIINDTRSFQDFSTQTDENQVTPICLICSNEIFDHAQQHDEYLSQILTPLKSNSQDGSQEQQPKYYTLQPEADVQYISATPKPAFNQQLSSPTSSTTDRSSTRSTCSRHHCSIATTKHNESSSSAYNTAESLPSSTYSDEMESLERVLNAACTMYTTRDNLQHTIKLQEELFRQRLRLRGITIDENSDEVHKSFSSEHLYDNIDDETSDTEKCPTVYKNRSTQSQQNKSQPHVTFSTDDDEQQLERSKTSKPNRVRFIDQHHLLSKRRNLKPTSRTSMTKSSNSKRHYSSNNHKNLSLPLSSNMLTVTIT